ncbi:MULTISPECIES: hypothetical protein [unclassified Herbaspirillum]|uniref:hypothetical protein n=1 Tax=unclassified Herbaspirillum TaxID=2624150 RepID=UPI000E2F795F|nr:MULTISPECIES: hypothetical protein [unclassified Herbaspirillum]RFB71153.1 hypothetical protein DZB54_11135 [Herbaspirillum sp. 3R-3a1]TFI08320.1 hypothetical protein E4P32_09125 [Herbaspirillum sp. 3R11]TFI14735.1 hypothetical protein E4P31_09120 [Herbaspirillum sp. 3R-11]TFI31873.1 hypothetical protein E4P30_00030 [Herbaspirillum sp. 3C11]TFI32044.1 hypothetical protein E4P30_01010 [Herbaspirillum sp. 3C11]
MSIYLYQISRHPEVGFLSLQEGDRPDWGDYAAIRAYFVNEVVDEEALYGFFPAGFAEQSGIAAADMAQFVERHPGNDAYLFVPNQRDATCFLNVFEEAEFRHPGFRQLAQDYLDAVGLSLDLREFVTDSRATAHTGNVLAKPVFWKTWFDLCEQVFALAEAGDGPLAAGLNATSGDASALALKVLLTDRIASLVLALDQQLRIAAFDHAARPLSDLASLAYRDKLPQLDAMKRDYLATGDITLIDSFLALRNSILQYTGNAPASLISPALAVIPARDAELVYGCITHVELPIRFPDFVTPIYLGESQAPGRLNLRELAPKWVPYHPIVGGMVGNFALRNYILEHHPKVKRIGVCMYRKFISRERISGVPAEENWMMDVVSDKELERQTFDSMLDPGAGDLLVGKTCGFLSEGQSAGYLKHYASAHHVEDLLRFAAAAVELGVLHSREVELFFDERVFFMGGVELGVFPAAFWLKSIADIEAVAWACVQRYEVKREGYQSRAWAFCAERLGSYLLLRYLRSICGGDNFEQYMGQLNLITRGDQTLYVPSN